MSDSKQKTHNQLLLEECMKNPEWVQVKKNQEEYYNHFLHQLEIPLMDELRTIGLDYKSAYSIPKEKLKGNRAAAEILKRHVFVDFPEVPLTKKYQEMNSYDNIQAGFILALGKTEFPELFPFMVEELRKRAFDSKSRRICDALANGVLSCSKGHWEEFLQACEDPALGRSRILFLSKLKRSKKPEARDLILKLAKDPLFQIEIFAWPKKWLIENGLEPIPRKTYEEMREKVRKSEAPIRERNMEIMRKLGLRR